MTERTGTDPATAGPPASGQDVARLRDLSPQQWKSGIAAWLGWFFDGLDMHLFTLVAAPVVAMLLGPTVPEDDPAVKVKSSLIQAPDCPYCWKLNSDGATGNRFCPDVIVVIRCPWRIVSGRSLS